MTTVDAQAFFRSLTGSRGQWAEDAHAYCDMRGIPKGEIAERLGLAAGVLPAYALIYWMNNPREVPSLLLDLSGDTLPEGLTVISPGPKTYWGADGKLHLAAANEWPLEYDPATGERLGRSVWEARTNKLTCYKHNPIDLTNFSAPTLDATLTIVDDSEELGKAGLHEICSSGTVYKYDNSLGTETSAVSCIAVTGNTNPHTSSAYIRGSGTFAMSFWGGSQNYIAAPSGYTRFAASGTPSGNSARWYINAGPGAVVYFILPQLEEGSLAGPVIPGDTLSAVTRAADAVEIPTGDWYNQSEGAFVADWGANTPDLSNAAAFWLYGEGPVFDSIAVGRSTNGTNIAARIRADGVTNEGLVNVYKTDQGYQRTAITYSGEGGATYSNGEFGRDWPLAKAPTDVTKVFLGYGWSGRYLNGHLRSLSYYPRHMTGGELQALSTIPTFPLVLESGDGFLLESGDTLIL